ncbi:MAG: malonyl-[acyl-carrier protein] O-methyltransferase BioC, partial [Xanthomonadales bacterium]|nr:malonyl-[acyl-carrier protein] O-methyltransferase BioC [Xanthomonadales bacterium]
DRHRGLTGKARMRAVFDAYAIWRDADGRLPSTWEVINAHAWGPEPGQPRRGHASNGEIATFPADRIPIRRKR